jgi:hypothetical protein
MVGMLVGIYKNTNEKGLRYLMQTSDFIIGAGNGDRTRDPRLGKPMLYQLSYARFLVS